MIRLHIYWLVTLAVGTLLKFGSEWLMFNTGFNQLALYGAYGIGVILINACIVISVFFVLLDFKSTAKNIRDLFKSTFTRLRGNF